MSFFGVEINIQLNRLMFQIRLFLAQNRYMPNIRTLYRSFVQYDTQVSGLIAGFGFQKALNSNGIFLKKYDIQIFQKVYNQNGKVNWFNFVHQLKQPMSPHRRDLVEKIFDSMDTEKEGRISTENLMSHFNYNQIDTYRYGKKNQEQITQEFLSMVNVQEGYVTKEEFVSFYNDLNINFVNNEVFFRYLSTQWHYIPEKVQEVREQEVRKYVLALRNKLLERNQCSKDELIITKLFQQFDKNRNSYLGGYDLDNMMKSLGLNVQPHLIEPILACVDRNQSGYIQFDQFKKFLYHHPYPY